MGFVVYGCDYYGMFAIVCVILDVYLCLIGVVGALAACFDCACIFASTNDDWCVWYALFIVVLVILLDLLLTIGVIVCVSVCIDWFWFCGCLIGSGCLLGFWVVFGCCGFGGGLRCD